MWIVRFEIELLLKKLTSRVGYLRQLTGSTWGEDSAVLRTATIALVQFMAVRLFGVAVSILALLTSLLKVLRAY